MLTSRNSHRKTRQPIRKMNNERTSQKKKEVETFQLVYMNIYQNNTYRKHLAWIYFNDEPGVPQKQLANDQQSYILASIAYPRYSNSN